MFWHINLSNLKSIKTGEKPTTHLYEINITLSNSLLKISIIGT